VHYAWNFVRQSSGSATSERVVASRYWTALVTVSIERLHQIAAWAVALSAEHAERARAGLVERHFHAHAYICHRNDDFRSWAGVIDGLVKLSVVTKSGNQVTLSSHPAGAWFGEGSVLKGEPRQYDIVAVRDTTLAIMDRATFMFLYENSVDFSRYLLRSLNERLGMVIASVENDRSLSSLGQLAQCIVWLLNPILSPKATKQLEITQEELALLSGMSRQMANKNLKLLEDRKLVRVGRAGIEVIDVRGLMRVD